MPAVSEVATTTRPRDAGSAEPPHHESSRPRTGVEGDGENLAERIYTLMDSGRYGHSDGLRCLYADARRRWRRKRRSGCWCR